MKLSSFDYLGGYKFRFQFENGDIKEADLKELISSKVSDNELASAKINPDWKCLEFNNGMVDIEPKTLFHFCNKQQQL